MSQRFIPSANSIEEICRCYGDDYDADFEEEIQEALLEEEPLERCTLCGGWLRDLTPIWAKEEEDDC